MEDILLIVIVVLVVVASALLIWRERVFRSHVLIREIDTRRKAYELAILKELGERIGYALDVERVVDMVTGSLRQFIEYTTVSYILLEKEKVIFKIRLEKPVARGFVQGVRGQMRKAISALLDREVAEKEIEEDISGALILENAPDEVRSFFNIPLVIDEKVVGLLTIADSKEGRYKEEDMTILYKIVAQASQAVTKMEQVVKTEQAKLGAMVESLIDGVIMTDRQYQVMVVNPSAKKYLDLENDPDIDIFDCIDNLDGKFDIRGKLEESIVLDKVITTDGIMIHGRSFQIVVSPVKGRSHIIQGQTLGGVVVLHDVTKEKEAEKLKEDFTSIMIHELRGPLDGIKKVSEVMHEDDVRSDKKTYDQYVKMIFESSSQMLELVNDLLDVARIESGRLTFSPRTAKLKQIINERVKFFGIPAEDKHISFVVQYPESISEEFEFDPTRVEQVLNNLLSNAVKYTHPGGKVVVDILMHKKGEKLSLEAKDSHVTWFLGEGEDERFKEVSDCVVVSVTDSGVGLTEVELKEVFSKFDKNDIVTSKGRSRKGLEIGLVLVKGIIEAHGGIVGVGSRKGVGSTFYFTINT